MNIRVLQLHKRASYEFKYIQDKYALNSKNNAFALADGTTQSFNSELWAELITNSFVNKPNFSPQKLIPQFKECVPTYKNNKFEYSSNLAKASLEKAKQSKGATATFIGIQIHENNSIEVISCGDTNLFIISPDKRPIKFPFSNIDSLDANNHFLNTEVLLRNEIDETFFKTTSIQYNQDDTIILATDALSRLLLKIPDNIKDLLSIHTFDQLLDFCITKWDTKQLEEDDISAIIITQKDNTNINIICPPNKFQFPKEKEQEFIPTFLPKGTHMEMETNEIKNQFNGISKDVHLIKSKSKLHEILLLVTIGLLIANISMTYLLLNKEKTVISGKEEIQKLPEDRSLWGSFMQILKK